MTQLTRTTHNATYPACAPSVVVAISSPDPTIEAASTMPGPMRRTVARNRPGGSSTHAGSSAYGLAVESGARAVVPLVIYLLQLIITTGFKTSCQARVLSANSPTGCSDEKHSHGRRPPRPAGRPRPRPPAIGFETSSSLLAGSQRRPSRRSSGDRLGRGQK